MGYALHGHLEASEHDAPEGAGPARMPRFALIDAGQLAPRAADSLRKRLGASVHVLFQGTFAEAAIALSPWLVELDVEHRRCAEQVRVIDGQCASLPIASFVDAAMSLSDLATHLKSHLRIEADGTEYLLRLADTQMLHAYAGVLTPNQVASFLKGVEGWWFVDHAERIVDLAALRVPGSSREPAQRLSAEQTQALLEAVVLPITASQLRMYDPSFGSLEHSEQMQFLEACLDSHRAANLELDLLAHALTRWQQRPAIADDAYA